MFYGPECGPHWRVFFVSLRRVCILLKLLYSVVLVSAVQQNELAVYMRVKVAESPLTLCDPTHGLYIVHGILQVRILEWVAIYSLLQGICPTQGSNPGLPHCRWILYQLSHRGSLYIYPLFFWISILFRLPEHWVELPVLHRRFSLVIYFIHSSCSNNILSGIVIFCSWKIW